MVAKQETAPGGIVDIITEVLAKQAKTNKDKEENRARVETSISTKTAAYSSAVNTSRAALKKGLVATKEQSDRANAASIKAIKE